ncbi:hypothetical protein F7725_002114 [Dissostichus mawsoni]|uniref:Methyltransferase type 12 domain-containing protein n=1 Tax=Dissostichus mawsoni TaxID=36200 RepID=A0A7J5Y1I2_DISMA|nr:hypothetical protein F7725_002114 [Dissostichus mawsoni]
MCKTVLSYLEDDTSQDPHVVPAQSASFADTSAPPAQQLSGVYGSFSPVRRHQQGALKKMHTLRSLSVAKLAKASSRLFSRQKSSGGRPSAPLGSRILTSPDDIFKHNMWDHVQWTEEDKENARQKAKENSCTQIPLEEQGKNENLIPRLANTGTSFTRCTRISSLKIASGCFQSSQNCFLQGIIQSYPHKLLESAQTQRPDTGNTTGPKTMTEIQTSPIIKQTPVGCGVGNSVFPIVNSIKGTDIFLYCCDFSKSAIQLVKDHPDYDDSVCHAFVHDICEESASFPFPPQSLDVILAVFVLSSIHPERLHGIVNHLSTYLKHGGIFLFRDYGRYDFSQLRFKKGRCLSENFYTRGDGTCVYFFTKEEVHELFSNAGLEEIQNLEDRRLQVNRGKKVAMHRVWMQSKFRKLYPPPPS